MKNMIQNLIRTKIKNDFFPTSISSSNSNTETGNHLSQSFELGMSLSDFDVKGKAEIVFYKGASPDGLSHTVRKEDGNLLIVHDSDLRLKLQPDLSNIPSTPLAFRNEVNKGVSKKRSPRFGTPSHSKAHTTRTNVLESPSVSFIFFKDIHNGQVGKSPKTTFRLQEKCAFLCCLSIWNSSPPSMEDERQNLWFYPHF